MTDRAIVLCGFMGCGKTTVGKVLARRLDRTFIDMDSFIERQASLTVSELFARYGEEGFRSRERDACRELSRRRGCVVAAGGGALTFPENAQAFRDAGCSVVLIDTPLSTILKRLEHDRSRPLLQRPDREAAARQLYDARLPLYRAAATAVVPGDGPPARVAARIASILADRSQGARGG